MSATAGATEKYLYLPRLFEMLPTSTYKFLNNLGRLFVHQHINFHVIVRFKKVRLQFLDKWNFCNPKGILIPAYMPRKYCCLQQSIGLVKSPQKSLTRNENKDKSSVCQKLQAITSNTTNTVVLPSQCALPMPSGFHRVIVISFSPPINGGNREDIGF